MTARQVISCILIVALSTLALPFHAWARAIDNYNYYPNDSTSREVKIALLSVGIVFGGVLIFKLLTRHRDPDPYSQLIVASGSLNFGSQAVGTANEHVIDLRSKSKKAITVEDVSLTGEGFSMMKQAGDYPKILGKGDAIHVTIASTPGVKGAVKGALQIRTKERKRHTLTFPLEVQAF
jgi:hypothetical protein